MIKSARWQNICDKELVRTETPSGECRGVVTSPTGGAACRIQLAVEQIPESPWRKKPRIRVALHERVDLELCVVEDVRGRRLQTEVDGLTHTRVQTHLSANQPTHTQL